MSRTRLIQAANGSVPRNELKPNNCHEAVLGWMLMAKFVYLCSPDPESRGVEKAWLTLRGIAERYGQGGTKQLLGNWFGKTFYSIQTQRITRTGLERGEPFPPNTVDAGDIIFMEDPRFPSHSIVVTRVDWPHANIRGFNNANSFGGPYMTYDNTDRDILDPACWNNNDEFISRGRLRTGAPDIL